MKINRMTQPFSARRNLAAAITLILLALFTYAHTFNVPFLYDDVNHILVNPHIRLTSITTDKLIDVFKSPSTNRPLPNLTLALNYYFGRFDVRGYHAVNLLVHILTAWFLFLVARQTLRLCGTDTALAPFLAAALWLVNPVHTQSITYTVQRMNSLAAMFYMLSLFCYIRARIMARAGQGPVRRRLFYAFSLAAGMCGLLSKEIAVTLPVMLFLYEWYFFQHLDRAWLKKQLFWISLATGIILLLAAVYLGTSPMDKILNAYQKRGFTPAERLLTEPAVVIYYLCLLLFPHPDRLMLLYDFPIFSSMITPATTLVAIMGIAVLVTGGLQLSARHRLLSFAIFWFLGNLLIESSVYGLALVFEHRTYLPSIFPFIALTALITKPERTRQSAALILGAGIMVCGLWTHQRNAVWNDGIRFWRDNAAKAPNVPQVNNNLGQVLLDRNNIKQAAACFKTALEQDPGHEAAMLNLGVALQRSGRLAPALTQYRAALARHPDDSMARFNLAMLLKQYGRTADAIFQLQKVIAVNPDSTGAMLNLGVIFMEQQQNERALPWFQRAAALDPGDTRLINNLGLVLHRLGRTHEAVTVFQQGLSVNRHDPALHNSLGLVLLDQHLYESAARQFNLALTADPSLAEAYNNLGVIAERRANPSLAADYYRQALRLSPAYDLARCNLAALLLETGQTARAVSLLQKPLTARPENWPALNRLLMALANRQELGQATALAEKMAVVAPDNAAIFYNLACLYARQNDREKAVMFLKKAVDKGYDRWHHLTGDTDLNNIYDTDYFQSLAQRQPG